MATTQVTIKNSSPKITATVTTERDGNGTYTVTLSLDALTGGSTYGYWIDGVVDDGRGWQGMKSNTPNQWPSGVYTTTCANVAYGTTVSFNGGGSGAFNKNISVNYDGYGNPTINSTSVTANDRTSVNYSVSYSAGSGSSHQSTAWNIGGKTSSSDSGTITKLNSNTTYNWSVTVKDHSGLTASRSGTVTTSGNAPVISNITPSVGDTTCTFPTSGRGIIYDNTSYASSTIKYRKQGASSWSTVSGPDLYNLDTVTIYEYEYTIMDAAGRTSNTATGIFTTTGQAKARLKINGSWTKGRVFLKKNGEWVVSKKIFTKKNGEWVETKN